MKKAYWHWFTFLCLIQLKAMSIMHQFQNTCTGPMRRTEGNKQCIKENNRKATGDRHALNNYYHLQNLIQDFDC